MLADMGHETVYFQVHATGPCRRKFNIGSGNGLVPQGNKPLLKPMLTHICRHKASLGQNELMMIIISTTSSIYIINHKWIYILQKMNKTGSK